MFRSLSSIIAALIVSMVFIPSSQAVVILFSDYDGTITNDRADGSMVTYYELFRVHEPAISTVQVDHAKLPQRILVSHVDYDQYETMFARQDGTTGQPVEVPLHNAMTASGKKIESFVPGHYFVDPYFTFNRFRGDEYYDPDVKSPENHWLKDLKRAVAITRKGGASYQGMGHDLAAHFLSSKVMATAFRLLTYRGYPEEAVLEVFKYMKGIREFKELPLVNPNGQPLGLVMLDSPKNNLRWGKGIHPQKKANFVEEVANQYRMTPPDEEVLNPDGTGKGHYHTFIFQEDRADILESYVKMAQDLSRRAQHRIKFVIRHLGTPEDMESNEFQYRDVVVKSDGSFRKAKNDEIFIPEETVKVANQRIENACARILAASKKRGGQK